MVKARCRTVWIGMIPFFLKTCIYAHVMVHNHRKNTGRKRVLSWKGGESLERINKEGNKGKLPIFAF